MPTVPRREPEQIGTQALPITPVPTTAPSAAFGGGPEAEAFARESRGIVGDIRQEVIRARNRADDLKVTTDSNAASRFKINFLENPETGALNKRGEATLESHDAFIKGLKDFSNPLLAKQSNREQFL